MVTARDLEGLDVDELVRRGSAAARVGENDEARTYLTEASRRDPENADAWLWLASVASAPQEKRDHFNRVLDLRPGDAEAEAGLARLAEKYGKAVLVTEEEGESLRCTWHPDRETLLRCNRCGRPMCTGCAVKHPVGLRCKECTRELRSPLYKVTPAGYAGAGAAAVVAGTVVALPMPLIAGFLWILAFFIGAAVGTAVAELVSVAAGRKRGKTLGIIAAAGMVGGVAIAGVLWSPSPSLGGALTLFRSIGVWIYLVIGIGAAMARLR